MFFLRAGIKLIVSLYMVISLCVPYGAYAQGDTVKATDHGIAIKQTGGTINIGSSNEVIKWLMDKYDLKEKEAQTLNNLYENEKIAHAKSKKKLSELAEEYNKFKANVAEIPDNDPLKKEADKCLAEGDFECAKITLTTLRQKRIDKNQQDLAKLKENNKSIAQSDYMLARLADIQYELEEASKYYLEAYELNPDDVNIAFYAGLFFAHHQKFDPKESALIMRAYEIYLALSDTDQEKLAPTVSMTLYRVSIQYIKTIGFIKSVEAGARGMELGPYFLSKTPSGYKQCVAMVWNILGNLYVIDKQFIKAEHSFNTALQKYRTLVAMGHVECQQDLAFTLGNLGNLYINTLQYDKGINAENDKVQIYIKLAIDHFDAKHDYSSELAVAWRDLGRAYIENKQLNNTINAYNEALIIYRKKAEKNDIYKSYVAETLAEIGTALRKSQKFNEAKQAYDDALSYCNKTKNVSADNSDNDFFCSGFVAEMLVRQGHLYFDTKNLGDAEKCYIEAKERLLSLNTDINGNHYLPIIVIVDQSLSKLYNDMNRHKDALRASTNAEDIQRKINSNND
jgi:tetratricopeptide (TPR) repeat protein